MSRVTTADIERAIAAGSPPSGPRTGTASVCSRATRSARSRASCSRSTPRDEAIAHAVALGANVLVTHHPAFLKAPNWLTPGRGAAGVLFAAMDARVALINAHTNLDRAPAAGHLLPDALGLEPIKPIERSTMPMALVTVFVPPDHAVKVAQAMSGAGAGRIGEYEGCRFISAGGVGSFTPGASAAPYAGTRGAPSDSPEVRLEMVAPRDTCSRRGRRRSRSSPVRGAAHHRRRRRDRTLQRPHGHAQSSPGRSDPRCPRDCCG